MKMTMGRTWKANTTPKGPDFHAQWAKDELAAALGVFQQGVDCNAGGLEEPAEVGLEHQESERELKAQAPEQELRLDGLPTGRGKEADAEDDDQSQKAGEPVHPGGPLADDFEDQFARFRALAEMRKASSTICEASSTGSSLV